ncbi:hypothetical protein MSAN_00942300 [Mycena sanguinolenta]|uniref:BTB domain-containing protein n=1 Tax=Mycena sanguinolenta TaxID=230812 RepID=A0A8H7DCA1_9AGAR|nr:hypothetical protein MSAN_00942300 [Mycena sanguinolenta]
MTRVFFNISSDALAAAAPDLAPVSSGVHPPRPACQGRLDAGGDRLAGAVTTPLYPPTTQGKVFPVHAVVLAAHCAKLLPLPPALAFSHSGLTLPVLPITLPSPPAFAILHAWIYTGRLDAALGSLLPLPSAFLAFFAASSLHFSSRSSASSSRTHDIVPAHPSSTTSAGGNVATRLSHAAHVNELWQDMVVPGVYDAGLWDAWEVVLGGMGRCAV